MLASMDKNYRRAINLILIVVLFAGAASLRAALLKPYTIDNLDFVSEEPFKGFREVRSSAILTTSYVDTDVLDLRQFRRVALLFDYTQGSLTSMEYRIWTSIDNRNWFVEATETVGAGVITDDPGYYTTDDDEAYFKILNIYPSYVKLEVKGTGTVTGSLLAVTIVGAM